MVDEIQYRYVRKLQSFWMRSLLSFHIGIEPSAMRQSAFTSIDRMGKIEKEEEVEDLIVPLESP